MAALVHILKKFSYWLAAGVTEKTQASLSDKLKRSYLTSNESLHYKKTHIEGLYELH